MAVVTHHPVVIHFEGIFIGFFTVDIDTVRLHFQLVAFVCHDTTFVDRQVVRSQRNGSSLGRNPDWAVVVAVPLGVKIQRIHLSGIGFRFHDYFAD